MEKLLERSRQIHHLLQRTGSKKVDFSEMADVLNDTIHCNVYVISQSGKILGFSFMEDFSCEFMEEIVYEKGKFPPEYNDTLLQTTSITRNKENEKDNCVFFENEQCLYDQKITTIVPIYGGGERLGTLVLARYKEDFDDQDLFLAEYGASVVGMEIMNSENDKLEKEIRKKTEVQIAVDTLSYSELEAVQNIFAELDGPEGILVASKIADKIGITRSVIVNALRKLESSGVIESRSLGMKGTHIKVLNDYLIKAVNEAM
ncbi:MAG: GTP-sensing pleiotropic transcriptional regulator CodY [Bacillota bacterium]